MVDDMISASGMWPGYIPVWQKVFWCFTEGLVAIALIKQTGALGSLRALSIVIGLPYTFFLCLMVPACYRALKKEMGDEDISASYRFNTQLLDVLELFSPKSGSPCSPATHITHLAQALFIPGLPIFKCYRKLWPDDFLGACLYALGAAGFYIAWIVCHILEDSNKHSYLVAWLMFFGFLAIVVHIRVEMRQKYNVWGSPVDDMFASLMMYPFAISQCSMMAETDGKDAPLYFASAEEVIREMSAASSNGRTSDDKVKEASYA
jgi:hypothetical protein